jgi:hypothetical protein
LKTNFLRGNHQSRAASVTPFVANSFSRAAETGSDENAALAESDLVKVTFVVSIRDAEDNGGKRPVKRVFFAGILRVRDRRL